MRKVILFEIEKIKKYIKKKPKLYNFLLNLTRLKVFLFTKEARGLARVCDFSD